MTNQTKLNELLDAGRLIEAESLLKDNLSNAEMIDPSNGESWARYADQIGGGMGKNVDRYNFWERLSIFFKDDLEPKWGHLHKGHIFFRLGWTKLYENVESAKSWLEKALEEDHLLEKSKGTGDVDRAVTDYSAYVALCLIERIEDSHFNSGKEKQKFFEELLSPSFNSAIIGKEMNTELVNKSIEKIVPKESLTQALDIKQELDAACTHRLQTATIALAGSLLESVLLGVLYYNHGLKTVQRKKNGKYIDQDIRKLDLGSLLQEADRIKKTGKKTFPSDSIEASCKTIHFFRNRLHPGNELTQKYKLTDRVSVTLKILLDSALVDWSKSL